MVVLPQVQNRQYLFDTREITIEQRANIKFV